MRFLSRRSGADKDAKQISNGMLANGLAHGSAGIMSDVSSLNDELLHSPEFVDAKIRIHYRLIDELNLSQIEKMDREELREEVHGFVADYVSTERLPLNSQELAEFVEEVIDELTGLGPIEPLLKDPTITDILINSHEHIYVEREGQLDRVPMRFKDDAHVLRIVNKIVGAVGRRIDESRPMVDARLQDGSRVNAAIPPVAVDGPLVSIRKFARETFDLEALVRLDTLSLAMATVLSEIVKGRLSIVISGGTGTGKTTLLNAMSRSISPRERLITIEDAAELQLQQPHVGRLETRPPNIEGDGEIRQRDLVKNALRMRPDRIILGEVRGDEAFDMLQAMSTGHEGSMTTIHANTARDALARIEQMIGMSGFRMSEGTVRSQITSAVDVIIQIQRFPDGRRRVTSISEVVGLEEMTVQMQELFKFEQTSVTEDNRVLGDFRATGLRPVFLDRLRLNGATLEDNLFHPGR
ncbi:MAG: CpaF family protein [Hyphomicrobiaceae bacterium]